MLLVMAILIVILALFYLGFIAYMVKIGNEPLSDKERWKSNLPPEE